MPLDSLLLDGLPPPPVDGGDGDDGRPRRQRPFLMPDFMHDEGVRHEWRGMYWFRHTRMLLWDCDGLTLTPEQRAERAGKRIMCLGIANVGSDLYTGWIRLWHTPGEVLPHIVWGGTVNPIPGGDGGAGKRAWDLYALTLT